MKNLNKFNLNESGPLLVKVNRGSSLESKHKVHAVVSDDKGRILMKAGTHDYETFIRSALKPFQALSFLTSGASEKINTGEKSIAIACGSHLGSPEQAREVFKVLWNSEIDVNKLCCPNPTNKQSKLQHNCSGKHAAFLSTCKKMNWPLENYLSTEHPLQKEIFRRISNLLGIPSEEFIAERDDCGAPTLLLSLSQMAMLYAKLSKSDNAEFEKITRAMVAFPEMIGGKGQFDSELIKRGHCQIVSKGGSEGIQCISRIGEGLGLAIKSEDGSKRAKHSAAIHLLRQLEWMTPTALDELQETSFKKKPGVSIEVEGSLKIP